MGANLKEQYQNEVAKALTEKHEYTNVFQIPQLEKIVINSSISTTTDRDKDALNEIAENIALITGQRPVMTKARLSISNFKLREEMTIGTKVTLRGDRMWEFLERLIHIVLPRIRDFRGVNGKSFDGRGNYALGLEDQTIFPEINPDKVSKIQGMDICIVTTANTNKEAYDLLKELGMPFAN